MTLKLIALLHLVLIAPVVGYTPSPLFGTGYKTAAPSSTARAAVQSTVKGQGYQPKWVKKDTLAAELGSVEDLGFKNVGLKGNIKVVFRQGNETRTSMAWEGQPLRDVASQAGQYIRYGCGKGECGTCECMVDGKWIRPCVATVDAVAKGQDLVVQVKGIKNKSLSSGKFYSIRSIIMGFWNNLLGMFGMVKFRKAAKKNWEERFHYEELVKQKTAEKRAARLAREAAARRDSSPGYA